ncbi:hypothetical protein BGZ79_006046, partial [Entomortierella chlamydospora]
MSDNVHDHTIVNALQEQLATLTSRLDALIANSNSSPNPYLVPKEPIYEITPDDAILCYGRKRFLQTQNTGPCCRHGLFYRNSKRASDIREKHHNVLHCPKALRLGLAGPKVSPRSYRQTPQT